ncbi:LacI family transcriptional regulator [Halobacillus andaensis]|uniref:LacI family transcriptional regulator n=1 Tax=Halobacillus andaensis TaxID=1176239 RepID=A0A917BA16_HALAA|nr:LacI family DNA-binding transcriptional regulator [Halobacillus andaensis]MBP2005322.1 DNA-binding LacI/PurR family transcriptional regulator [Halobacillus andaensis]GGF30580.1 LacI family transcriptional regulator [Halobacillus andaensis]
MSVTIKDVAKRANVAPSTVSRVISDSPRISEDTKRRVRKIMEEMGYHLNLNGRVLVRQSTQTIGIVMKDSATHSFENPFFSEILKGISESCHKRDYSLNLTTGESEESIFQDVVKMVQGKRVDGIIVLYSKEDDKVAPYLMKHNFPFVVVGKPLYGANKFMYVDNDNIEASREATNYLIDRGHRELGFIGGDLKFEVTRDRLKGFKLAAKQHGIEINDHSVRSIDLNDTVENGKNIVKDLMGLPQPPTGLVITDDYNGLTVMSALQEQNIKVPDNVSIIGFNNTMIAKLANPPLTTVDTNPYQLGYEASNGLIDILHEPSMIKRGVIIPTNIVERDSCLSIKPSTEKLKPQLDAN